MNLLSNNMFVLAATSTGMPWEGWLTLIVIVLMGYALVRNMAGPDTIMLGGLTIFMTMHIVSPKFPGPYELVAGFGNEGLITIAVLFVVAAGLAQTGAMELVTQPLLGRPKSLAGAQARMMAPVAGLSAFMNNTPIVAMFIPVIADWCRKRGFQPGKLFIPLSYAAILGGTCSLIGTATNIYVYGSLDDVTQKRMGMFTISLVGIPVAVVGITYLMFVARRLLPEGKSVETHIGESRQYTVEMLVEPSSTIVGKSIEQAGLRNLPGAYLMAIERDGEELIAVGPEEILREDDRLIFVGVVDSVRDLQKIRGLMPATNQVFKLTAPRTNRALIEAVVSDQCPLIGKTVRQGRFRSVYDAVIIAVHRGGEHIDKKIGDIVLRPGDTLLIEANPRFVERHRNSRDFFLTSAVEDSQPVRHNKAWLALAILIGMVAIVQFTPLPLLNAALIACGLMVVFGCCAPAEARNNINWRVLLAMGAAIGVGKTLEETQAAHAIAQGLLGVTEQLGPRGILAGLYLATMIFNMLIGHAGAAALAIPIAVNIAQAENYDVLPFAIVIMLAASADFANPVSYPTHLMVFGAGGYKFSDFVKIGLPLNFIVMAITVALTPVFWPLTGGPAAIISGGSGTVP